MASLKPPNIYQKIKDEFFSYGSSHRHPSDSIHDFVKSSLLRKIHPENLKSVILLKNGTEILQLNQLKMIVTIFGKQDGMFLLRVVFFQLIFDCLTYNFRLIFFV